MKTIQLLLTLIFIVLGTSQASALKVYLWGGQSNGYRMSYLKNLTSEKESPHQIYFIKNPSCTDETQLEVKVELITKSHPNQAAHALGQALTAYHQEDIAIIACQRCGRGVFAWDFENPKSLYHTFFLPFVMEAKKQLTQDQGQTWELQGIFWSHFEGDSNSSNDENAKLVPKRFTRLLQDIKTRFSTGPQAFVPVIANTVIPHEPREEKILNRFGALVNQQLKSLESNQEIPHIHIVDAGDIYHLPGDIHFANANTKDFGAQKLATRMGEKMVSVLQTGQK